jgi:hypothetical protein
MNVQPQDLARLPRDRLDQIFRDSRPGHVPIGRTRGTALLFPGTAISAVLKPLIRAAVWKGKVFRPESKDLKNLVSPFAVQGIRARVYEDASWFDAKPATIIDYSDTSFVARMVRDEIREVVPGLYLGQIFLWKKRVGLFMLEAAVHSPVKQTPPLADAARL